MSAVAEEIEFKQWVNYNNPDDSGAYGKGWWDSIDLLSSIARRKTEDLITTMKVDFGKPLRWWTMSSHTHRDIKRIDLSMFLLRRQVRERALEGFSLTWLQGPFEAGAQSSSARLDHKFNVYGEFRQISQSTRWMERDS